MVHEVEESPDKCQRCADTKGKEDITKLSNAGEGQEPFVIGLDQAEDGTGDDAERAERHQGRGEPGECLDAEDVEEHAGQRVDARRFAQDAGHRCRHRGRGRGVGVRQPGVERYHRHLEGEADEEERGDEEQRTVRAGCGQRVAHDFHVQAAGLGVDKGDAEQHHG